MEKVMIASDHAGYPLKQILLEEKFGFEFVDLGPNDESRVDYPDYADMVCKNVILAGENAKGILVCGSGQGMCMRANKFSSIRAALCWDVETAKLARAHNDANLLCLGSRVIDHSLAVEIVRTFFSTEFEGGRHATRIEKVGATTL